MERQLYLAIKQKLGECGRLDFPKKPRQIFRITLTARITKDTTGEEVEHIVKSWFEGIIKHLKQQEDKIACDILFELFGGEDCGVYVILEKEGVLSTATAPVLIAA